MGQMTVGILYGCECPELPDEAAGEERIDRTEAAYCLIGRWEKTKRIEQHRGPRIRIETEGGPILLGVWVAVGGSGEDGAPYFLNEAVLLSCVVDHYRRRIKQAERLWGRFAGWCEKREGVKMPLPKLWLTPCEVA